MIMVVLLGTKCGSYSCSFLRNELLMNDQIVTLYLDLSTYVPMCKTHACPLHCPCTATVPHGPSNLDKLNHYV